MERQFRINWPAIVEEAKQRRKGQKLTQQRLGKLAGVSTPTISHFEGGERDIQLSTVTNILGVLGMLDERVLVLPVHTMIQCAWLYFLKVKTETRPFLAQ
jgi:predicted transcriptional regulator